MGRIREWGLIKLNYKEISSAFKKINKWYGKRTKVLSIKTRPFNTFEVFSNIITKVINNNGTVLYVWCSNESKYINLKKEELYESIIQENDEKHFYDKLINISIQDIKKADGEYDLVIIDDISMFSKCSNEEVIDAVEEVYWRSKKIIIYAAENIFPIGEKMELIYLLAPTPIIEPRFLSTRIKLEENIPLALFDYFRWFKENKRKVVIFVPTEGKLNKVYNHYYTLLKEINIRVIKYEKSQDFKYVEEVLNGYSDSLFIITNVVGEYFKYIDEVNIILLFADDLYYSYKKIVYTCASVQNNSSVPSEVIMVSKELSNDMDKAKSITRMFNRSLWEKNYLIQ